jgi:hypothetical protein
MRTSPPEWAAELDSLERAPPGAGPGEAARPDEGTMTTYGHLFFRGILALVALMAVMALIMEW